MAGRLAGLADWRSFLFSKIRIWGIEIGWLVGWFIWQMKGKAGLNDLDWLDECMHIRIEMIPFLPFFV